MVGLGWCVSVIGQSSMRRGRGDLSLVEKPESEESSSLRCLSRSCGGSMRSQDWRVEARKGRGVALQLPVG